MTSELKVYVGDVVKASKFVWDKWYHAVGTVTKVALPDNRGVTLVRIQAAGLDDWYEPVNDLTNTFEIVQRAHPEKVDNDNDGIACHYCGQPSISFGFFDEPVCEECGG
jgi:hypothetical protein